MPQNIVVHPYKRYVSFDGDADRIIYYYTDNNENFYLVDGDRMAILSMHLSIIKKKKVSVCFKGNYGICSQLLPI